MANEQNLRPPWKSGESGNLNGRPIGAKSITTLIGEALEEVVKLKDGTESVAKRLLVKRILDKAIDKGDVRMIQMIWEQLDGRPNQKIDLIAELGEESRDSIAELTAFFRSMGKHEQK